MPPRREVCLQLLSSTGTKIGPEIVANTWTEGIQDWPSMLARADGTFVVWWTSNSASPDQSGTHVRVFDGTGQPLGPQVRISKETGPTTEMTELPDGRLVAVSGHAFRFLSDQGEVLTAVQPRRLRQVQVGGTGSSLGTSLPAGSTTGLTKGSGAGV